MIRLLSRIKEYITSTITGRVITVIMCTLIPVVALVIFLSVSLTNASINQFFETNKNELQLYVINLDNNIGMICDKIDGVIYDNWSVFMGQYEEQQLVLGNIKNYMEESVLEWNMIKYAFYKNGTDIKDIALIYRHEETTYSESISYKNMLSEADFFEKGTSGFCILNDGTENFLVYYVNSSDEVSSIGFAIAVSDILGKLNRDDSSIYLMSNTNKLYTSSDELISEEYVDIFFEGVMQKGKLKYISILSESTGFTIVRIMDKVSLYEIITPARNIVQVLSFITILIIPILWFSLKRNVIIPLKRIYIGMKEIKADNMDYRMDLEENTNEFREMKSTFNQMVSEIQDLRIQTYEREIEKLQIEAVNMKLQVNPHMLLNSLNIIYNLALTGNRKGILQFTECLSEYFRYALGPQKNYALIKDELKFIESYLNVQKIRFPNRFVYVYSVPDELMEEKIPPLLLQNFIENTIKYGMKPDTEIEIIMVIKKENGRLNISIVDTGMGMTADVLEKVRSGEPFENNSGKHIGIWNCRRRLKLLYGPDANISITSARGEGTQIWIDVPISSKECR